MSSAATILLLVWLALNAGFVAIRLYVAADRRRPISSASRRHELQRLWCECASDNDCHNKKHAAGVSQTERNSQKRKCREMFKLRAGKYRTGVYRGQRRINDESQCQPTCNHAYPLNHRC